MVEHWSFSDTECIGVSCLLLRVGDVDLEICRLIGEILQDCECCGTDPCWHGWLRMRLTHAVQSMGAPVFAECR
jgi:hypothetical protein